VSGKTPEQFLADKNLYASEEICTAMDFAVNRALNGEPLAYILGEWEFYGLPFYVGKGVLIPRPDTETVVETAINLLKGKQNPTVFDLCAGSGCIGITLAHYTDANVKLFEKSVDALLYIFKNIKLNGVEAEVYECDVLGEPPLKDTADLIISNPPYIRSNVLETLEPEVKREPIMALDGGEDGLIFYRHIAKVWKKSLNKGGWLVFEIGFDQAEDVTKIMQDEGFSDVQVIKDLGKNNRVVLGHI
jgi:release factor glutamine methyltransferase